VYDEQLDVNSAYNLFLDTFLFYFNDCFPIHKCKNKFSFNNKGRVTPGIRISSQKKRYLHKLNKNSNDPSFLAYVRSYKSIFKKCVIAAKKPSTVVS